jgi:hypothetical protein
MGHHAHPLGCAHPAFGDRCSRLWCHAVLCEFIGILEERITSISPEEAADLFLYCDIGNHL